MSESTSLFPSYSATTLPLHPVIWSLLRGIALFVTVAAIGLLMLRPAIGLALFWGLLVPSVPMLLVIAPGFWRQICPMALANQTPRILGFSRGMALPPWLRDRAYGFAVVSLVVAVALRVPLFNGSGVATAGLVITGLLFAFCGGLLVKGRAGWCGTFCPLGPIQRNYGLAPLINIPNGFCLSCVACQKNCYDLNPRAALFLDLYDEDPRYAGQHRLFMAMLPGIIFGFFGQMPFGNDFARFLGLYAVSILVSAGSYGLITSFGGYSIHKAAAIFAAAAIVLFYFFTAPIITTSLKTLTGFDGGANMIAAIRLAGLAAAASLIVTGFRNGLIYEAASHAEQERRRTREANRSNSHSIVDQGSGREIHAVPGDTLLAAIVNAGLAVEASCRSGLCGADAVMIIDGAENLTPASEDELATLRRLGLEGRARLACSCHVNGPLVIQRDLAAAEAITNEPPLDFASVDGARIALALRPRAARSAARIVPKSASRILVIGNGVAGTTLAQVLTEEADRPWHTTLVSNEPYNFYNRMGLAKVLTGDSETSDLMLMPEKWYEDSGVAVVKNTRVAAIDRFAKRVTTIRGETIPYDRLVIATGSRASTPSTSFLAHENCFVLRNLSDAVAMRKYIAQANVRRVAVLGGGVLGVEAAEAFSRLGLATTLVHRNRRLLEKQLAPEASAILEQYLAGTAGVRLLMDTSIVSDRGDHRLCTLRTTDEDIDADLFVACLEIVPNVELAQGCGLEVGNGIRVDAQMRTSDPDIFAVGDVAETDSFSAGLWQTAVTQARAAALAIAGKSQFEHQTPNVLRLKSDGIDVYCLKSAPTSDPSREIITAPPFASGWWRLEIVRGRIEGANYVGAPGSGAQLARAIRCRQNLEECLPELRNGRLEILGRLAA